MTTEKPLMRKIRSYVMRSGRMSERYKLAMDAHWQTIGLNPAEPMNPEVVFGRKAPLVVEIGFGMGDSLLDMAAADPDTDFIGIEVHEPGVGRVVFHINDGGLKNLRLYRVDAVDVLTHCFADSSIDRLQLYFPDPWHKKKHHKRRLVQIEFAALVYQKLTAQGQWHIATDWENYAEHCIEVMSHAPGFTNVAGDALYVLKPVYRPQTKFERRGERLGHGVWDMLFAKVER
jgi:tRNA (guanine-N7-)-methyltransferase